MDDVVLACRNLRKRFDAKVAIDDVSFEVGRGRIVGLLGPNGAGKTTLIRMILDIFPPDEGTISFMGAPLSREARRRLGYLPEERGLYRRGKLAEVLIYLARLRGVPLKTAHDRVHAALAVLGYAEYANRRITDLSKGMAQRVQFIVASVHLPELVVLDEPFSGLDPVGVQWASQQIRSFRDAGITVLLSAHQMALVEQLCDSVVMVHRGQRVLYGTLDDIRSERQQGRVCVTTAHDLTAVPALAELARHRGGERWELLTADTDLALRCLVEAGVHLREFSLKQPTLEEIFLDIVGAGAIDTPPGRSMRDLLTVASYEFGTNVRRWEFLAVTFGLPIFMVGLMLVASIPNFMYLRDRANNPAGMKVGVVDETKRLHFPNFVPAHEESSPSPSPGAAPSVDDARRMLSARGFTFVPFETLDKACGALLGRQVDRVYHFPSDYFTSGHIEAYSRRKNPFDMTTPPPLGTILREQFLAGKVDAETLERVRTPFVADDIVLDNSGHRVADPEADQMASVIMPYSMMVLLMMSLLGSSNYILRSLVEEKESRVREILLSSVRPADLFYGKIFGLGLLGFFQVGVWLLMATPLLIGLAVRLPLTAASVALFLLYFVLGFLLYASIIAGIGAIGSTEKESNQIFAIFVLMFSSPLLFMPILLDSPDGALQRFFTLCPFTSASMVALRTTQGGLPPSDLALSLLLLIGAVWLCMRLSLKVFELGLLLWGKTPTPAEIWRALWAR